MTISAVSCFWLGMLAGVIFTIFAEIIVLFTLAIKHNNGGKK